MKQKRKFSFERLESRAMLSASGDFNGDGRDDLVVAAPGDSVSGKTLAGSVSVIYGSGPYQGLGSLGSQLWTQDTPGVNGKASAGNRFGRSLAVGDFNGDGFDDLAIGSDLYNVDGVSDAGAVHVLYGSASGLRATRDQQFTQNTPGVESVAETADHFGSALAAGDFDGDGRDDLAIGVPGESIGPNTTAGAVNVLYGTNSGLSASGDQLWHQDFAGINGTNELLDAFGSGLAAGDFNGDGRDDLAVNAEFETITGVFGAGEVHVIYGRNSGLHASGDQVWSQAVPGVLGSIQNQEKWGYAMAVGDFNGDGNDDLAVGAASTNSGVALSGEVNILYGSSDKITIIGNDLFGPGTFGFAAGDDYRFAAALAAGDFNADGFDDLAIGMPGTDLVEENAGYVRVCYGTMSGVSNTIGGTYSQGTELFDAPEAGDFFGTALTTGDYDGDGRADLVIGAPYEDVSGVANAGVLHVIYGFIGGLNTTGDQLWSREFNLDGGLATGAVFGSQLQ